MSLKKSFIFILLMAGFAISYIILTLDIFKASRTPEIYEITVITRTRNNDSWESVKHGAEQAAGELFVDMSFITLSEDNHLNEQIYLIERESLGGADAIVISAADSERLTAAVNQIADKTPVISIDSPVLSTQIFTHISADDYAMGNLLGNEIIASKNAHKRIAVIVSGIECRNISDRLAGLKDVLDNLGENTVYWELPANSADAAVLLNEKLQGYEADVLIALDLYALELAGQTVLDNHLDESLSLFGFGATGKITSFIERGVIEATIVKNDFAIGYLGIEAAVAALSGRPAPPNRTVEHRLITNENMYDIENQRLLFPAIR